MAEKKKSKKEKIDPYFLSNGKLRSEFSPDFEEKRSRVITPEGLYGTASGKTMFESPIVDPDTSMMQNMAKGGKIKLNKKPKKAFMGLAVQASKNPMSLIGLASKNPMSLIGGANKLLKRSQTARDVSGKLGVGGKLISNYYNDKESDKKSSQSTKSPEFTPLEKGGSVTVKTKLGRNKATKLY